jgi:hypothetical protein
MIRSRRVFSWALSAVCAGTFVAVVVAADQAPSSQGVVTPDDPIFAQEPQTPPVPAPNEPETNQNPSTPAAAPQIENPGRGGRGGGPRPYNQVITNAAKTDDGVFKVHRVGETVYYEIPRAEFGKDFLWVTQIKRTTLGAGYGGQEVSDRVVRWEQSGNRVFLKLINYDLVADPSKPIAQAVADANNPTILRAFNVAAVSGLGNPVIDVTQFLLTGVPELSAQEQLGAAGVDMSRTFIDKIVSFPQNVNVEVTQTVTAGRGTGRGPIRGSGGTIVVFYSMVRLPEKPMMARLYDQRVGYFAASQYDFGRDEPKAVERDFILRYRLEKKDPTAALSEPVKPIVYYVDPATPSKFVPWIKKAVEDWQPAFEAAGFKNAIIAKDAPSKRQDPDWDAEDVRYSVIRWLPSTIENAIGPNIHDPRSGEILEGDIQLYHNIQNLATMWYFSQVGPLDPRAKTLPLPDDLMGRLIQQIVTHEIGHTLGLRHNMKASSLYTIAQIRDKDWVKENGHTPSLMDYARYNYVAQPEDGIAVDDLIPKIGPYDKFAVMWGYKPVPSAKNPDDEKKTLNEWASEQDKRPFLRFMTGGTSELETYPVDPGQQREAVGDMDPVAATTLGLKNLKRVSDMLVSATTKPGEPYDDLAEAYLQLVVQWRLEMGHVADVVGGVDTREIYPGQIGKRFITIPKARQAQAVQFLVANAFKTPTMLINPDVLERVEPYGAVSRLRNAQTSLLNSLLQAARLDRMAEQASSNPTAYAPLQLLTDLRAGVWSELAARSKSIDIYRRNVQRGYLDVIDNRLNGGAEPTDEVRSLLKGELRALDRQIAAALPATTDAVTQRHLQDSRDTIQAILDPRAQRTRAGAPGGRGGGAGIGDESAPTRIASPDKFDFDHDPFALSTLDCWPTYRLN